MKSQIKCIEPYTNERRACSAHGVAARCTPLVADVILRDEGSPRIRWAVCGRWLRENPSAVDWLARNPAATARLGDY